MPRITRVTIAKDALKWINEKKLVPRQGNYAYFFGLNKATDVKSALKEKDSCAVCALGACALTVIARSSGRIKLSRLVDSSGDSVIGYRSVHAALKDHFPKKQLELMETAFEQGRIHHETDIPPNEEYRAYRFGRRYKSDTNRLKAILNNVIENRGNFKPHWSTY